MSYQPPGIKFAIVCGFVTIFGLGGVSGCGAGSAQAPAPTPAPTVTATMPVGFTVAVTAVPTRVSKPARATPTATKFIPPKAPYIVLEPASGPPVSREIVIRAGHLPRSSPVALVWSPGGHASPLLTTAGTDRSGNVVTTFTVPATPPGTYAIQARVGGATYASALYRVASRGSIVVSVSPGGNGDSVHVVGKRFVPGMKLLLASYPMFKGVKPMNLGIVQASRRGSFVFDKQTTKLPPGQYLMRVWSVKEVTTEMAEAYFQVVL